jgi:predicted TIM-barrel fold metal-dependent hydrolase
MLIVDSQVHIWAASTPVRPWPQGTHKAQRAEPFGKDELLREMDKAGVSRAVLCPPAWEGHRNDLVLAAAQAHPDRFGVMGSIKIDPASKSLLPDWRRQKGMLGLRLSFKMTDDDTQDWLWDSAQAADVPIMLMAAGKLAQIDRVAQRFPRVKLIIDHIAIPPGKKDAEAFAHLDELIPLARHPNIAVKVSSMPSYTTESYPYKNIHPHLRSVYDAFGAQRMFWGADFTKLPKTCSYRQAVTLFTEELPFLTAQDREWIMGRALCEWLAW